MGNKKSGLDLSTFSLFTTSTFSVNEIDLAATCNNVSSDYADSEGPDQPAYQRSIIRTSLSANRIIG